MSRSRPLPWIFILRCLVIIITLPVALAASPERVLAQRPAGLTTTTTLSRQEISLGERADLVFKITAKERISATEPVLALPIGLLLEGPNVSTSSRTTVVNGRSQTESTVRLTFGLIGNASGTFDLPAPTVMVGSTIVTGSPTRLTVTGGTAQPAQPTPFDDLPPDADEDNPTAKSLALADGPTDVVFLRAFIDKEQAYVGEQVTMSTYLYYRVGYEMTERTDARFSDLLRVPLLQDPATQQPIYTRVRDKRYGARLIDRVALIPLRAGKLATGTSSARLTGREIGSRVLKTANDVTIDVIEPPTDGRPSTYVVGDVGQFQIGASVRPRTVKQGGSISVNIKIEGSGYIPASIKPPNTPGVTWLDAQRTDALTTRGGKVGGARTLAYIVRLENAGTVDLGTLELPYFDPVSKQYEVTKTALGSVEVEERPPTADELKRAKETKATADNDPLASMPAMRTKLSLHAPEKPVAFPLGYLAVGMAIPPMVSLLLLAAGRVRRAAKDRGASDKGRTSRERKRAFSDADNARKRRNKRELGAAIERMFASSLEHTYAIRMRGLSLSALEAELGKTALPRDTIKEIIVLLTACEETRFAPASAEASAEEVDDLHQRAKKAAKAIG